MTSAAQQWAVGLQYAHHSCITHAVCWVMDCLTGLWHPSICRVWNIDMCPWLPMNQATAGGHIQPCPCAFKLLAAEPCWLQTSPEAVLVQPSSGQGPRVWRRTPATYLLPHFHCTAAGNMAIGMQRQAVCSPRQGLPSAGLARMIRSALTHHWWSHGAPADWDCPQKPCSGSQHCQQGCCCPRWPRTPPQWACWS